jgi:hypothetical protein
MVKRCRPYLLNNKLLYTSLYTTFFCAIKYKIVITNIALINATHVVHKWNVNYRLYGVENAIKEIKHGQIIYIR